MGNLDLNNEQSHIYEEKIIKIIRENTDNKLKNIYFNIQNDEIIIRNINNIKSIRKNEVIKLIKYDIGNYMPLNLQNYIIRYKKITNTKGEKLIQGILIPKKYVDICKSISEKLNTNKKYLYINFDILQKLIDLKIIDLSQIDYEKVTIIENRGNDIILNKIINRKVMESYAIDKSNGSNLVRNNFSENTYYYGVSDHFIDNLKIKKLHIEDKLILNTKQGVVDKTLDYLSAWGMII